MQAVDKAHRWGLLPDPAFSCWPKSTNRAAGSLSRAPLGAAVCSAPRSAASQRSFPICLPHDAHCCAAKHHRRDAPRTLGATAGDGSDAHGATMPAKAAAAPDEARSERMTAVRNLERALDPEAAEAAELRRRHKEAVELARTGDPEMALACLHSLLAEHPDASFIAASAAEMHGRLRQWPEARGLAARAAELAPTDASPLQIWAYVERGAGDQARAAELMEASTKLAGARPAALASAARFFVDVGAPGAKRAARKLYERALQRDPDHAPSLQGLAVMEHRTGNIREARALFGRAITADAAHVWSYQAWGVMEAHNGNPKKARELFQQGAEKCEPHAPLFNAWAHFEAKQRRIGTARRLWERALNLAPHNGYAITGLAALEARSGNHQRALELYETGLSVTPDNSWMRLSVASCYRQLQDTQGARQALTRIFEFDPHNGHAWAVLGQMDQADGDLDAALESFRRGTTDPRAEGALRAFEGLALLQAFRGTPGLARATFQQGAAAHEPTSRFLRGWALFEKRQGCFEAAADLFRWSSRVNPSDDRTWMNWALMERRRGRLTPARRLFRRAIETSPRNPYSYQALAAMEWQCGDRDEARRVLAEGPRWAPLLLDWAQMEAEEGAADRARELLNRAVKADPGHAPAFEAWAALERRLGNDAHAAALEKQGASAAARAVQRAKGS